MLSPFLDPLKLSLSLSYFTRETTMVPPMKLHLRPGSATASGAPPPTSACLTFVLIVHTSSDCLPKHCRCCVLCPCLDPSSPTSSKRVPGSSASLPGAGSNPSSPIQPKATIAMAISVFVSPL
uniref:Predicted protein n=1 Tax=Hordeum vulgare subsp. vulgare TaxID=112509 RepID=F2E848_HORVV|nr:predicted protein [Hordeum vulgare subsp. vulgare]